MATMLTRGFAVIYHDVDKRERVLVYADRERADAFAAHQNRNGDTDARVVPHVQVYSREKKAGGE
jgi:hypothetical protein